MILRCLIDAARKIQRELQAEGHDFHCVVFVRNDVYQLLLDASADYGKEKLEQALHRTDPDWLREMLRRRLYRNSLPIRRLHSAAFGLRSALAITMARRLRNTSSSGHSCVLLISIKLLAHCRGFAVGMGTRTDRGSGFRKRPSRILYRFDHQSGSRTNRYARC